MTKLFKDESVMKKKLQQAEKKKDNSFYYELPSIVEENGRLALKSVEIINSVDGFEKYKEKFEPILIWLDGKDPKLTKIFQTQFTFYRDRNKNSELAKILSGKENSLSLLGNVIEPEAFVRAIINTKNREDLSKGEKINSETTGKVFALDKKRSFYRGNKMLECKEGWIVPEIDKDGLVLREKNGVLTIDLITVDKKEVSEEDLRAYLSQLFISLQDEGNLDNLVLKCETAFNKLSEQDYARQTHLKDFINYFARAYSLSFAKIIKKKPAAEEKEPETKLDTDKNNDERVFLFNHAYEVKKTNDCKPSFIFSKVGNVVYKDRLPKEVKQIYINGKTYHVDKLYELEKEDDYYKNLTKLKPEDLSDGYERNQG